MLTSYLSKPGCYGDIRDRVAACADNSLWVCGEFNLESDDDEEVLEEDCMIRNMDEGEGL